MKKERREDSFIKQPYFKEGNEALKNFIEKNLKYPKEAFENDVQGIVIVTCDIDHKGNVIDAKIKKGIGNGCDEESIRVAKMIKFEIPGIPRKLKVIFHKDLRFPFSKVKKKEEVIAVPATQNLSPLTIQYQVKKNATDQPNNTKIKNKISYTITYS